jgi:hypothetical protein
MAAELDLPDEVLGFGSCCGCWQLARPEAFAAARRYGMVDGNPVPTPSLVAWLLTTAEYGVSPGRLAARDPRQKVLRTIVSRAIGGEPRLFKDSWLHELAALYRLGDAEVELLACCRGEEGYPVDPAALRAAIAGTLRTQSASGDHGLAGTVATRTLSRDIASFIGREPELRLRRPVGARFARRISVERTY